MSVPSRTSSPPRPATDATAERWFLLNDGELRSLGAAIAEAAGPEVAEDSMFRLGRRWGSQTASRLLGEPLDLDQRLERGLARMAGLGLGRVTLESVHLDGARGECRVRGKISDPLRLAFRLDASNDFEGTVCALSSGYLTGFLAELSGVDVVCSPFHCANECDLCGGSFEIHSTTSEPHANNEEKPAPSGSARFFLGSLGRVMAESDLSLDDLLEKTPDAVILIGNDQVIRFWNRGAEDMFLWPREEVVGRRIGFLLPSDLLEQQELEQIQAKLERGEPVRNVVTRRTRKDGTELWVSLTRTLLHDSHGNVIGSTATLRDITEHHRTQEALSKAQTLAVIGELAAKIAHEIKNPLAGMYGAVHVLARQLESDDPRRKVLESVQHEIRRLDDTVLELLCFARPEVARLRPTALRHFVDDLIEPLSRQFGAQGVEITCEIDEALVVPIDAKLMNQALGNLVINAAQALGGPGRVLVTATTSQGQVELRVEDSGPGIPAELIEKIFEPFFTTRSRGSGLGLAIARKNAEAHGGTIAASNRPEGGACLRLALPLPAAEEVASPS